MLGLGEPVTIVTVEKGTTLTESVGLVEPTFPPAPEYTAVIAVDPSGSDVVVNEAVPLLPMRDRCQHGRTLHELTLPVDTGAGPRRDRGRERDWQAGIAAGGRALQAGRRNRLEGRHRDRRAGGADAHRNGAVHDHAAGDDISKYALNDG